MRLPSCGKFGKHSFVCVKRFSLLGASGVRVLASRSLNSLAFRLSLILYYCLVTRSTSYNSFSFIFFFLLGFVISCCNLPKVVRFLPFWEKNTFFENFPINQLPLLHFFFSFYWNGYLLSFVVLNFLRLSL